MIEGLGSEKNDARNPYIQSLFPKRIARTEDSLMDEAYHLLRCLIHMAMVDSVLDEAENEVLEQVARSLGQLDVEVWEKAWDSWRSGTPSHDVLNNVPQNPRLQRFILRELVSMAYSDGALTEDEDVFLTEAASIFNIPELARFIAWGERTLALHLEGEALLIGDDEPS